MVGLSCWMNDVNVEAPMRSPAAAKTVFGFAARTASRRSTSAAAPPDGRRLLDAAVEVVDGHEVDVDAGSDLAADADHDRVVVAGPERRARLGGGERSTRGPPTRAS